MVIVMVMILFIIIVMVMIMIIVMVMILFMVIVMVMILFTVIVMVIVIIIMVMVMDKYVPCILSCLLTQNDNVGVKQGPYEIQLESKSPYFPWKNLV